jgi:hypothetical protein
MMSVRHIGALLLGVCVGGEATAQVPGVVASVERGMVGDTFVSAGLPPFRMRVPPAFRYLGHFEFDLADIAHVDRHVFVEASGNRIGRMIVLQFEAILPTSSEEYRYRITNPIPLAGVPYRHNMNVFSLEGEIADNPDAELAHTRGFLQSKGLELPDEQVVSRFARIVGEARKHELLIFYHENLADLGHQAREMSSDGTMSPALAAAADSVKQRSLDALMVLL